MNHHYRVEIERSVEADDVKRRAHINALVARLGIRTNTGKFSGEGFRRVDMSTGKEVFNSANQATPTVRNTGL